MAGTPDAAAPMPDAAMPDAIDQPHSSMVSLRGASQAPLAYAGGGLWSAQVMLPAGRVQLGLTVDGTDLGVHVGLAPPFEANVDLSAPLVTLELPLGGPYEARFDERAGTFGLRFGTDFRNGLSAPGRALIDLLEMPDDAHVAALRTAVAQGELPVVRGGDVLFIDLDHGDEFVAGSWNSWSASADGFVPLAGGTIGYVGRPIGMSLRGSYKLVRAAAWRKDPHDFEIEWDGFNPGGPGDFNSVFYTEGYVLTGSRLRWLPQVASTALAADGARDVYVYLPAGYDAQPARRFPSLYVHDGNESIVRSQFQQVADTEIAAGHVAPLVMVFVALPNQNVRTNEYTFATTGAEGDAYVQFLADELRPRIDQAFRTIDSPTARGVAGASLGGLISFYAGWRRDDVWRRVSGQSSSLFWANNSMITLVQAGPAEPLRIYLDSGCPDDNCDVTEQMSNLLAAQSYDFHHVEQAGAQHDWSYWKQRFPGALAFLFPPSEYP